MFWTRIVLPVFNVYSKSCKNTYTTQVVKTMVHAFISLWLTNGTSKMVWCTCVQFPFYPLGVRIGKDLGLLGRNATRLLLESERSVRNARHRWQTLAHWLDFDIWLRIGWAEPTSSFTFTIYVHVEIINLFNIPDMEGLLTLFAGWWKWRHSHVALLTIALKASVRTRCHVWKYLIPWQTFHEIRLLLFIMEIIATIKLLH